MESSENILIGVVAVSILCISFSTWITLSDLRAVVVDAEGQHASGWVTDQTFASRAIEHIEHPLYKSLGQGEAIVSSRTDAQLIESWGQCYVQNHTE